MEPKKNLDEDISFLFEDARDKLEKAKKQLGENKKKIVADLAESLEGRIRTDTICIEIVNQLRGEVSQRFVRKCLDEKYKNDTRVKNANKQKKTPLEDKISIDELAAQLPLNNKEMVIVEANGHSSVQIPGDPESEQSSNIKNASNSDKTTPSTYSPLKKEQEQLELKEIKNCLHCNEKSIKIIELEVALKKSSPIITANEIKTIHSNGDKSPRDILYFEFRKSIREIRDYISPLFSNLGDSGPIWFSGTIDKNTGELISSSLGRTDLTNI